MLNCPMLLDCTEFGRSRTAFSYFERGWWVKCGSAWVYARTVVRSRSVYGGLEYRSLGMSSTKSSSSELSVCRLDELGEYSCADRFGCRALLSTYSRIFDAVRTISLSDAVGIRPNGTSSVYRGTLVYSTNRFSFFRFTYSLVSGLTYAFRVFNSSSFWAVGISLHFVAVLVGLDLSTIRST
jgi:hypothetical protein